MNSFERFIDKGAEEVSTGDLACPSGKLAWFCIKGPKKNTHEDALGIQLANGEVHFSIADGPSSGTDHAIALASLAVRTALQEAAQNPKGRNEAALRAFLEEGESMRGAVTLLSGSISPTNRVHAHLVGDNHSGTLAPNGELFPFPHPALMPEVDGLRHYNRWLDTRESLQTSDPNVLRQWELARVPYDPRTELSRCINFVSNFPHNPTQLRRHSAELQLETGTWFIAGSDGLRLNLHRNTWMTTLEKILRETSSPTEAVNQIVEILQKIAPDNATGLVYRAA